MRTRIHLIIILFCIAIEVSAQYSWVSIDNSPSRKVEISKLTSSQNGVSFTISIPGFYSHDTIIGSDSYQQLVLPGTSLLEIPGKPAIPIYTSLIAIPVCDSIQNFQVEPMDSVKLGGITVVPAATSVFDSVNNELILHISADQNFYSTDAFYPDITKKVANEGALRDQPLARVTFSPIRFNPVSHEVWVYTSANVTISFTNPVSDINIDVGLFGNIANKTLLNYTLTARHANEIENPNNPGNVYWVTNLTSGNAKDIIADYLIIADSNLVIPYDTTSVLYKFAKYRSQRNTLDIAIIPAKKSTLHYTPPISGTCAYPYALPDTSKPFQCIRALIQEIYCGSHANHTFDHHLAYVLFVGRAQNDTLLEPLVPASIDLNPGYHEGGKPERPIYHNDYYYSCLSATNGVYSNVGSLFIGRFSVRDTGQLSNIYKKIVYFENEANALCNKDLFLNISVGDTSWFQNDYKEFVINQISPTGQLAFPYTLLPFLVVDSAQCQQGTFQFLTNNNVFTIFNYGHSNWDRMLGCRRQDYNAAYLNPLTKNKFPFCVTHSCAAGWYDSDGYPTNRSYSDTGDCFAEYILRTYPDRGFIGMVAGNRNMTLYNPHNLFDMPRYLSEYIPVCIWNYNSTLAGEFILEAKNSIVSKLSMTPPGDTTTRMKEQLFGMNYFGDPALDLMASGNYISQSRILNCPTTISSPLIVIDSATLTIPNNCQVTFVNQGSIRIAPGSTIQIGDNVNFIGSNSNNKITIEGILIGSDTNNRSILSNETFTCINGQNGNRWGGLSVANTNGQITFQNSSFNYGNYEFLNPDTITLSGNISNQDFDSSCFIHISGAASIQITNKKFRHFQLLADFPAQHDTNTYPCVTIQNCLIQDSLSPKGYVIRLNGQAFDISHNELICDDTIGIDIQGTMFRFRSQLHPYYQKIDSNVIRHVRPAWHNYSIGINLYASNVDILRNRISCFDYGIACIRNSTVYLPPQGQSSCAQQTIANNYTTQLQVFNSSWPPTVFHNYFDSCSTDPNHAAPQKWIYYNCLYCPIPDCNENEDNYINCKRDITQNNWGTNPMHLSSFYPTNGYEFEPYCGSYKDVSIEGRDALLYFHATAEADTGNIQSAKTLFDSLVRIYPLSQYASPSIRNLFDMEQAGARDFLSLKSKYQADSIYYQTEELNRVTQFMIKECNLQLHLYNEAITWLNNEVLYCHDYTDSICALIDLGYINSLIQPGGNKQSVLFAANGEKLPENTVEYNFWYGQKVALLFREQSPAVTPPHNDDSSAYLDLKIVGTNPVSNGMLSLKIYTAANESVELSLINMNGTCIIKQDLDPKAGIPLEFRIDVHNAPSGLYIWKAIAKNRPHEISKKIMLID